METVSRRCIDKLHAQRRLMSTISLGIGLIGEEGEIPSNLTDIVEEDMALPQMPRVDVRLIDAGASPWLPPDPPYRQCFMLERILRPAELTGVSRVMPIGFGSEGNDSLWRHRRAQAALEKRIISTACCVVACRSGAQRAGGECLCAEPWSCPVGQVPASAGLKIDTLADLYVHGRAERHARLLGLRLRPGAPSQALAPALPETLSAAASFVRRRIRSHLVRHTMSVPPAR